MAAMMLGGACQPSERESPDVPPEAATFVFGTSADPIALDGALVSDGESLRAINQMFEGLVALKPGTTELVPGLAESWEISEDGLTYTFDLRENVRFHDGTDFDADAVCFNFERWYNFEGSFQNADASYYYQTVFGVGGFAHEPGDPKKSIYRGCDARDDDTVVLSIKRSSASMLSALSVICFGFASPSALRRYEADKGRVDAEGVFRPGGTYATEHPTGTGPYEFKEWIRGERLVLVRNDDYWGDPPGNIETLIFRPIADPAARLQALQTGEIQGYDLVDPQDFDAIQRADDLQLLSRPTFNVGYIGLSQGVEPLDDLAVRRAIGHAIDREAVVDAFYEGQGVVAQAFMPPDVPGYTADFVQYDFDPRKAKQILEDAGYSVPVEVDFAYPTDVERPYMPNPRANFEAMVTDLESCCFDVDEKSATWTPDYLSNATTGKYGMYLLGWTGDFADADNFIGTFFQDEQPQWQHGNETIHRILDEAELEIDPEVREHLYQEANRLIADEVPGIPYVHTEPAVAVSAGISGFVPSPTGADPFWIVTI